MTPRAAKLIIKQALDARGLPYSKLTARTVNFSDLARASCVFVRIAGWQPNLEWNELKAIAKSNGFCIES